MEQLRQQLRMQNIGGVQYEKQPSISLKTLLVDASQRGNVAPAVPGTVNRAYSPSLPLRPPLPSASSLTFANFTRVVRCMHLHVETLLTNRAVRCRVHRSRLGSRLRSRSQTRTFRLNTVTCDFGLQVMTTMGHVSRAPTRPPWATA